VQLFVGLVVVGVATGGTLLLVPAPQQLTPAEAQTRGGAGAGALPSASSAGAGASGAAALPGRPATTVSGATAGATATAVDAPGVGPGAGVPVPTPGPGGGGTQAPPTTGAPRTTEPPPAPTTNTAPVPTGPPKTFSSEGGTVEAGCTSAGKAELLSWTPIRPYKVDWVNAGPGVSATAVFVRGQAVIDMTATCNGTTPTVATTAHGK
jgi:serine/threonine-protein kinase